MSGRDFYRDGYRDGYGRPGRSGCDERAEPASDGDRYDYRTGREDGERRRRINEELEREGY